MPIWPCGRRWFRQCGYSTRASSSWARVRLGLQRVISLALICPIVLAAGALSQGSPAEPAGAAGPAAARVPPWPMDRYGQVLPARVAVVDRPGHAGRGARGPRSPSAAPPAAGWWRVRRRRPAGDAPRADVGRQRRAGGPGPGADAGQVRRPRPARPAGAEHPVDQARRLRGGACGDGGAVGLARPYPARAQPARRPPGLVRPMPMPSQRSAACIFRPPQRPQFPASMAAVTGLSWLPRTDRGDGGRASAAW